MWDELLKKEFEYWPPEEHYHTLNFFSYKLYGGGSTHTFYYDLDYSGKYDSMSKVEDVNRKMLIFERFYSLRFELEKRHHVIVKPRSFSVESFTK
jgi:hypothetical protein